MAFSGNWGWGTVTPACTILTFISQHLLLGYFNDFNPLIASGSPLLCFGLYVMFHISKPQLYERERERGREREKVCLSS